MGFGAVVLRVVGSRVTVGVTISVVEEEEVKDISDAVDNGRRIADVSTESRFPFDDGGSSPTSIVSAFEYSPIDPARSSASISHSISSPPSSSASSDLEAVVCVEVESTLKVVASSASSGEVAEPSSSV